MSGKHRERFYLKLVSVSMFAMKYHSLLSFLFMMTPVERRTISDERAKVYVRK